MSEINIIITDCDGVLTDGKTWVNHEGEITKGFNTKDVAAIREIISLGYEVYIITASSWPGLDKWAKKTGAIVIHSRDKGSIKHIVDDKPYIAVGDDVWDIPLLKNAALKFAPSDSIEAIKDVEGVRILNKKGGEGIMAELLKYLV